MKGKLSHSESRSIAAAGVWLAADLIGPHEPCGVVIFVHGSGSSRFSRRNRRVAGVLNEAGFVTVLADLLTPEEEAVDVRTAALRFDIPLLAERTFHMIEWAQSRKDTRDLPIGLFGASTGAAAAIIAASRSVNEVRAVVSRGGRADLAGRSLELLRSPLLMIVGSLDLPLLEVHDQVIPRLACEYRYEVIPGAGHLFEEPGTLDAAAALACSWFENQLPTALSRKP